MIFSNDIVLFVNDTIERIYLKTPLGLQG